MIKRKLIFCVLLVFAITSGCGGCGEGSSNGGDDDTTTVVKKKVSKDMIYGYITSIPNPVEMSSLLQKSGVVYSQELLNPSTNIRNYNTTFQKALNLGVYGTDLVHMNIYDRTVSSVLYLKNIKDLANDLKIGQFFDYETLQRLAENSKNVDSVLYITSTGFDRMNNFLINDDRGEVSVLLGYGTWIESLYLATNVQRIENKEDVYNRLGGQQKVMDNMIVLLESYKDNESFKPLLEDAYKLKKQFERVKIVYNYVEPTRKEVNGTLVIIDNSTETVDINDEIVKGIKEQVAIIRNKLIQ